MRSGAFARRNFAGVFGRNPFGGIADEDVSRFFRPDPCNRTKEYSYIENYAQRPLLDLPWDIESAPGEAGGGGRRRTPPCP